MPSLTSNKEDNEDMKSDSSHNKVDSTDNSNPNSKENIDSNSNENQEKKNVKKGKRTASNRNARIEGLNKKANHASIFNLQKVQEEASLVLNFKNVKVLEDHTEEMIIQNNSLIPAVFSSSIKGNEDCFSLSPNSGTIPPNNSIKIKVLTHINDPIVFRSKIMYSFQYLTPIYVDLIATGEGSTIIPSINMKSIDIGESFINNKIVIPFQLRNCGRRMQDIKWNSTKPKFEGGNNVKASKFDFKVSPEGKYINPGETLDFQFIITSRSVCSFEMIPTCFATIGKSRIELFHPKIFGKFLEPILQFNEQSLNFIYTHNTIEEEQLTGNIVSNSLIQPSSKIMKPIVIPNSCQNLSLLPLDCEVTMPKHFTISVEKFTLEPQQSLDFNITFDPSYKTNFSSEKIDAKAIFSFCGTPNKY